MTVRIVTDATASLSPEVCRRLGISVVPVPIHFGTETVMDGLDPASTFYARLATSPQAPTTATPSPGDFLAIYRQAVSEADEVVAIHLMETKSALINTARLGAALLPDARIHLVDGQSTSLGLGLLAMAAAKAAQQGWAAPQIVDLVERLTGRISAHAAIRDLTQLRRSGRVSLGQALLAGVLSMKPILYIGQGVIEVVDKVRGWPAALGRTAELAAEKAGAAPVHLAVIHTNAEAEAQRYLASVRHRFTCIEAMVCEAGSALAAHGGPGVLGLVTLGADPELGAEPLV